jgi:hypothetical protein
MKQSDFKSESELKAMKVAQIKQHVREFNDHLAIRGYSKATKDQLIGQVLTAQDRVRNSKGSAPKPISPVKSPAKKAPVKKAPAKKAKLVIVLSKAEAKKQITTLVDEELESEYLDTLSMNMSKSRARKIFNARQKRAIKDFWSEYKPSVKMTEKEWEKAWKDFADDVDLDSYGKSNE